MKKLKNVSLKDYSSFHSGGSADDLIVCENSEDVTKALELHAHTSVTALGFGTNVLISDSGITGTTIIVRSGSIKVTDDLLVAEAGVWWDDLVLQSLNKSLWGVELMSGIPSSIGGAIMGNIAAYGQQISDTLEWVEVFETDSQKIQRIAAPTLTFGYRYNSLSCINGLVVLRAAFKLSHSPTQSLEYGSALRIAKELNLNTETLTNRRAIILEARRRAGSLYDPTTTSNSYTAGSFFKNPVVPIEVAKQVIAFDETSKSAEVLLRQNQIHGGSDHRVSAAHVMLAAGFKRGQSWGPVRLHPEHILKIENIGQATSQQIYNVAMEIIDTVQSKLGVTLEPEVRFLGEFTR